MVSCSSSYASGGKKLLAAHGVARSAKQLIVVPYNYKLCAT